MNKNDLVKVIAEKTELTQKEVAFVMEEFISVTTKALKAGEEVAIAGLGKFVAKTRKPRTSINPRTKERISVPAAKAATFKSAKALKDALN
ncbi:MAG: HU family DNA-binding protein [Clostridia bacterium]|nr:HU family DNA-binding protein [Clostridia bacterium]